MEVRADDLVAQAERATANQEWSLARDRWNVLACSDPRNKDFRAHLAYARARERLEAGDRAGGIEQLEWVLRLAPSHAQAREMLKQLSPVRFGLGRLLRPR